MALWDVQRDVRDNRIIAIRPAKFTKWGTGDNIHPLKIAQEELGLTYSDLDAVSLDKGGDGLTKTRRMLAAAEAVKQEPVESAKVLTVADLEAEIIRRGYKPLTLAQIVGL